MITSKSSTHYGSEGLRFDSSWLHFPSLYKPASSLLLRVIVGFPLHHRHRLQCCIFASQLTPKLSPLKVVPAI